MIGRRARAGHVARWASTLCLLALPLCTPAGAADWRLARGPSSVSFTIGHLVLTEVSGRFTRFSGSAHCPDGDFTNATIEATIEVDSIYSGHQDRDRELLTDDFFFAEKFPQMRFASRSVTRIGPDAYTILGDLTIRGITREIVLDAEHLGRRTTTQGERVDFRATASLNRFDYGVSWNPLWTGRILLDETVQITLEIALIEEPDDR